MDSNFHMLRTFQFHPKQFGVCTAEEVSQIEEHFKIKERSDIELQNLRDFVVLYISQQMHKDDRESLMDMMSAITAVIDEHKWKRGMEV